MDGTTGRPDGAGSHIWLRYTTQFSVGERINTIEIGIPVPLGASEETRERLLREADAGMDQLMKHVDSRAARMQYSGQATSPIAAAKPSTTPAASISAPANRTTTPPVATPASTSSSKSSAQTPAREAARVVATESKEINVPPTRPNIGASMPSTLGLGGNGNESMKLPQFIQFIKEKLGLSPKEAMDRLNVRTLTGVNLREAFEQLQQMMNQEGSSSTSTEQEEDETESGPEVKEPDGPVPAEEHIPTRSQPTRSPGGSNATAPTPIAMHAANKKAADIVEIRHAVVREVPPKAAFDEELEDEELGLDEGDDEELDFLSELTEHERDFAEDRLSKLREARGSSAASGARLQVLNNVIGEQLTKEQLLELIRGVWSVPALNKLKNEQVEALISWAKEDAFIEEAEVVLAFIRENNNYARSDR
ncbi:MAG: hypothetical protein ACJ788_20725 [Ktedonobacteraceae bacterium]